MTRKKQDDPSTQKTRSAHDRTTHIVESSQTASGAGAGAAGPGPDLGTMLGNYRVLRVLGRGGAGVVYEAEDLKLERKAALKFLHRPMDPDRRALLEREARTIASLGKHPSIVQVYEWGEYNGQVYFAMEFLETSASALLKASPAGLPPVQALDIVTQCGEALSFAHARGVLHRDVKPANILFEEDRAKLSDFGLAVMKTAGDSGERGISGSPGYMAPEQARGEALDERTDVFGIAVTLYVLLSGQLPFEGSNVREVLERAREGQAVPLRSRKPALPVYLTETVAHAMHPDPGHRYPSAAAFAEALRELPLSKGKTARPAKATALPKTCSVCHNVMASAHSMRGTCRECGAGICYRCWAKGRRACAAHEGGRAGSS